MKRYKKWGDWLKEAKSKMEFLAITANRQKVAYIKSCAGAELLTFWEKEARIRFEGVPANQVQGQEAVAAHTFNEIVALTEKSLLSIINRDRAVIDLLAIRQGDKSVMELLAEAEDQVKLCRANDPVITEDDLLRMCLIVAFKDRNLAEKALAENYDLKTTIQVAVTRESSKSNAKAMQGKGGEVEVKRVRLPSKAKEEEEDLSSDPEQSWTGREELEELLSVLKVRQHAKYSGRFKPQENRGRSSGSKCKNCDLSHQEGDCRAAGKECFQCGGFGHYARATACPKRTSGRGFHQLRLGPSTWRTTMRFFSLDVHVHVCVCGYGEYDSRN